jgi:hypothetical protein
MFAAKAVKHSFNIAINVTSSFGSTNLCPIFSIPVEKSIMTPSMYLSRISAQGSGVQVHTFAQNTPKELENEG